MKRKRTEDDFCPDERFGSKERKISNDPEGRIRTDSMESRNSRSHFGLRKSAKNINFVNELNTVNPIDNAMIYSSQERDMSSSLVDSSLSLNLITAERANEIRDQLLVSTSHSSANSKRNWSSDEVKLLDFTIDRFCQSAKKSINLLTTNDWKQIASFIPGRSDNQCAYKWRNRNKRKSFSKV